MSQAFSVTKNNICCKGFADRVLGWFGEVRSHNSIVYGNESSQMWMRWSLKSKERPHTLNPRGANPSSLPNLHEIQEGRRQSLREAAHMPYMSKVENFFIKAWSDEHGSLGEFLALFGFEKNVVHQGYCRDFLIAVTKITIKTRCGNETTKNIFNNG